MTRRTRLRAEPLEDRLAPAAGQLDPSFDADGIVRLTDPSATYVTAVQVAALPGGGSLALLRLTVDNNPYFTTTYAVTRLNAVGGTDATFGTNGRVALPNVSAGSVPSFAATPDGGAVVFGPLDGWVNGGRGFRVTKLTSGGALDAAFGTGGETILADFGTYGTAIDPNPQGLPPPAPVVLGDGTILLLGNASRRATLDGLPVGESDMSIARLTATGQLVAGFGTNGVARVSFPIGKFNNAGASSAAVQPNGKIVVGGQAASTGIVVAPGTPQAAWATLGSPVAVRLNADGTLDGSNFADGGRALGLNPIPVAPSSGGQGGFDAVKVLPDGRIVLSGYMGRSEGNVGVAVRLSPYGILDQSYGTSGVTVAGRLGMFPTTIDSAGRVIFNSSEVVRLTQDGRPDPRFGANGQIDVHTLPGVGATAGVTYGVAVEPDGDILLAGGDGAGLVIRVLGDAPPTGFVATGAGDFTATGAGGGAVQVIAPAGGTYASSGTLTTAPGAGAVRSTTADVNGDGTPDYITVAGPGGIPVVTVTDGNTGVTIADFLAFEPTFTGGMFVAAANLEGDDRAEIIVTPDQGGGPRVVIFSVAQGGAVSPRASFFGFDDANFRGGARIAAGDVNRDGTPDLVVAAGFLGGPRVVVIDGRTAFTPDQYNPIAGGNGGYTTTGKRKLVGDFFAFSGSDAATLRNGVYVAAGDVNGDGFADLVFGGGPGGAPRVYTLSGELLTNGGPLTAQLYPISNFFIDNNGTDRGGVTVATTAGAVAVGSGQGNAGRVRVYRAADVAASPAEPAAFQDVSVFGGAALPGGVFVG